tara:strand:+ start:680 stop:964 length:285 start_codon:yes stop_codon:yes gene_type:complete
MALKNKLVGFILWKIISLINKSKEIITNQLQYPKTKNKIALRVAPKIPRALDGGSSVAVNGEGSKELYEYNDIKMRKLKIRKDNTKKIFTIISL